MRKFLLAVSVTALTIASPVFADKGGHGGGGQGNGNGGGNGGDHGGQSMKAERGHGGGNGNVGGGGALRSADKGGDFKQRGNGHSMRQSADRGHDYKDHGPKQLTREIRNARSFVVQGNDRIVARDFANGYGKSAFGCPPGLDKKGNGCLPPGQAKKFLGARLQNAYADSLLPFEYRSWYRDDGDHFYRSGDGFIYRVSRSNDLVDGIIPLFGGGGYYALGDQWPDSYNFYNVPYQYRHYYADTGDYSYRYGDGAIYRLNSGTGVVDSIVALLAGDLGVGQQLPMGYDTYNVPFAYRDRYADTTDNWYRYNDGYIYQVDPKTRLISAVINAIV